MRKLKVLLFAAFAGTCLSASANSIQTTTSVKGETQKLIKVSEKANSTDGIPDEIKDLIEKEGTSIFYNEGFSKIPGSIDSPAEISGTRYQIDQNMLEDANIDVYAKGGKGVGGAVMIESGGSNYLSFWLGETRGRHRNITIIFHTKSANPQSDATFDFLITQSGLIASKFENVSTSSDGDWFYESLIAGNPDMQLEIDPTNENGIIIDRMIITTPDTVLNGVMLLPPSSIEEESFTANWKVSYDAKGVLLDVFSYSDEETVTEIKNEEQSFADLNITNGKLNKENPGMPDNWYYRFSKETEKNVETTGSSFAPVINKSIEYISTPNNDEIPYKSLSFDLKGNASSKAYLIVEEKQPSINQQTYDSQSMWINDSYKWNEIGRLPLKEYTDFTTVDLTENMSGKGIYIRFRISEDDINYGAAITNIKYSYGGDTRKEKIYVDEIHDLDLPAEMTSYTVSDLEPEKEYFYRLRTYDDNYVSDYSINQRGRGILSAKEFKAPVTKNPTNVTEPQNGKKASFTANWESPITATFSTCQVEREFCAKEEIKDFAFLTCDDFSSLIEGTVEDPVIIDGNSIPTSYIGNVLPGYTITNGAVAKNMLGIKYYSGMLTSPVYDFEEGGYFKLNLHVANGKSGDELLVTCYNDEEGSYMSSRKLTLKEGSEDLSVEFPMTNYTYFTIKFNNISSNESSGRYVYFDRLEISMDLDSGDKVNGIIDEALTFGNEYDFRINNLTRGDNIGYKVIGTYQYGSEYSIIETIKSEPSNLMIVWKDYNGTSGIGQNITECNNKDFKVVKNNGSIGVELSHGSEISVYDISGNIIERIKGSAGYNQINIANNGVYIIKVDNDCVKIVK